MRIKLSLTGTGAKASTAAAAMPEAASRWLDLLDDSQRQRAEYDNTARDANHVHTVWRDPVGDFGRDVLPAHYASSH